ncbi:cell division protein ZapA [Bacillota bacterium LX-D]|nr:cell division protein ZapA [Bacillota bacterium LX-D]
MQQDNQNKKSRTVVNIYDSEYVVRSDEAPEYIEIIANYVDQKMRQIAQKNNTLPLYKIAVLAALNIADEQKKIQDDYDSLLKLIEEAKEL